MRPYFLITLLTFLFTGLNLQAGVLDQLFGHDKVLPIKGVWVNSEVIGIQDSGASHYQFRLHFSTEGRLNGAESFASLSSDDQGVPLNYVGEFYQENTDFYKKFDYLSRERYGKFMLNLDQQTVKQMLKGQVVISKRDPYSGKVIELFALSHTGVIDQLFNYQADDLGLVFKDGRPYFKMWAPTATSVKLRLYTGPEESSELPFSPLEMQESNDGTWAIVGNEDWKGAYYRYEITSYKRKKMSFTTEVISDLYSVNTAKNGKFSQIVDVENEWMPNGWKTHKLNSKHSYEDWSDISLYELHVRDFSYFDFSQPKQFRGKYLAFTNKESNGVRHLQRLADAGMTHIHLLPVNDQSSVNEIEKERVDLSDDDYKYLSSLSPDSTEQQEIAGRMRLIDGFNWGYDPFHYQALEGIYATNPDDESKIIEFRQMVMSLHQMGLAVVSDVVYNHYTELMSLDAFVPDYFYNMNCGVVTMESCCPDLATENAMVAKLIVDSATRMVKWYRLDSVRFDLMGFLTKDLMRSIRQKFDAMTLEKDGVDGKKIFLYGEGWHFGPLVRKLPEQAVTQSGAQQLRMGLATFNDRFRDAVKGKGQNASDLFVDDAFITDKTQNRETVLMGLMGSLIGVKDGYVNHPYESINYLTAHDKNTLWDTLVAKVGPYASTEQLVKMQQLSLSILSLAQGVPFYHAGEEILRSKSGDENSYDSGDWFNRLDFSYQHNGWASGLPPRWVHDNYKAWDQWKHRLNYVPAPGRGHIMDTLEHSLDMLKIRKSSKLLRLRTRDQVLQKVELPFKITNSNGQFDPRLVVMKIDDTKGAAVDSKIEKIWVAINSSWGDCLHLEDQDILKDSFQIHPVLKSSRNRLTHQNLRHRCFNDDRPLIDKERRQLHIPPQSVMVFYTLK